MFGISFIKKIMEKGKKSMTLTIRGKQITINDIEYLYYKENPSKHLETTEIAERNLERFRLKYEELYGK